MDNKSQFEFPITHEHARGEETEADFLIEKRECLKEEIEKLRKDDQIRIGQDVALFKTPEQEIAQRFEKMVNRIFEETPALDEIKDTLGKENLLKGLAGAKFPTEVNFGAGKELETQRDEGSKKKIILGDYSPKTGAIRIKGEAPNPARIWKALSYGWLPKEIETLDHELIHLRYDKTSSKESLSSRLKKSIHSLGTHLRKKLFCGALILIDKTGDKLTSGTFGYSSIRKAGEFFYDRSIALRRVMHETEKKLLSDENFEKRTQNLQSELAAQKAGNVFDKRSYKTTSVVKVLTEIYGFNKPLDIDRIIIGSLAIDRLRALNLSDSQIAEQFKRAVYDTKSASFPLLDREIKKLARVKGLSVEDIDTKVDLMRVEGEINMLEAAKIAQDELSKLAEEVKEKLMKRSINNSEIPGKTN